MNTPIIANLIPRLRETVATQMKHYLGGEGELSGIYESLEFWWDGIRDREFPELPMWSDLPTPDRDALFDAWIEAVEDWFYVRRVSSYTEVLSRDTRSGGVGKPVGPSNASGAGAPPVGADVLPVSRSTAKELFRQWWNTYQLDKLAGYGPEEKEDHMREAFLGGFLAAPAASCTSPAPLVPEVAKEALEALETCVWSGSIGGGKEYDEEKVESALRSYSPVPSPSVELLRELRTNASILLEAMEARTDDFTIGEFLEWGCVSRLRATLSKLNAALA